MKYVKKNLFVIIVSLLLILIPSIAVISFSQSNDTSSGDTSSNKTETFSSMSHSFGENQSENNRK
ncbi:MAG TPA: hypothetical protein VH481_02950 [Nitrososphaeraceae archaeon]